MPVREPSDRTAGDVSKLAQTGAIHYPSNMDQQTALDAFSALSQETRLAVFRLLVSAGPEGMTSGEIGESLNVRQNTMSTNLGILLKAGLVRRERDGRNVRYHADHTGISGLLGFLLEDCCGGNPDLCQPIIRQLSCN